MTVSAGTDEDRATAATPPAADERVDLRRGGPARAGSHVYAGEHLVTPRHRHEMHQIEYAVSGVVEVESDAGHYLLPPQQAAWIPAGLRHETTLHAHVRTIAVLFDPDMVPDPGDRVRILAVPPLVREMVLHAVRWPVDRPQDDAVAQTFFTALAHLVGEALEHEAPLSLPRSDDPLVRAALAHTRENLAGVTFEDVSRAVGVSERTLRRRMAAALPFSWRRYVLQARLLRAMTLLSEPGRSVLDVSVAVGFEDVSAFTRAFSRACGETPSAYRRRVVAG